MFSHIFIFLFKFIICEVSIIINTLKNCDEVIDHNFIPNEIPGTIEACVIPLNNNVREEKNESQALEILSNENIQFQESKRLNIF